MSWNNPKPQNYTYGTHQLNPDNLQELKGATDKISSISWFKQFVCCSSWDKCLYLWEIQNSKSRQVMKKETQCPILSTLFVNQGIYFGNFLGQIKIYTNNQVMDIGKHDDCQSGNAITSINYVPQKNLLISSSWDKKCCYWDLNQKKCVLSMPLTDKVYKCCVSNTTMIALCPDKIFVFDLRNPKTPQGIQPTGLKVASRSLALSNQFYAVGSIGGRVAIKSSNKNKSFTFKCGIEEKIHCFPVNDMCFHPNKSELLGTVGSNGRYSIWDVNNRRSIYKQKNKITCSLTCCSFDQSGKFFAVAVSYDFSRGTSSNLYGNKTHHRILLHPL